MIGKIYCLQTGGYYLSIETRDLLMFTAMYMIRDKCERRTFKAADCEGEIKTFFEPTDMGGISGYKFVAVIETDVGKRAIIFLVRARDYEGLEKSGWFEVKKDGSLEPAVSQFN